MFQMKDQEKTSEEELSEMGKKKKKKLPNKEFKVVILKILKVLGRRENKQNDKLEVFNKELENINKLRAEG